MPPPARAESAVPSHVDGELQLGLGLGAVVLGAALLAQLWLPAAFPVSLAVVLWVGATAVVFGLLALRSGLLWARSRRTARRFGPHAWAGVCLQPERELALRVLVVDPATGVHLLTPGGPPVAAWTFAELRSATVEPLHIHRRLHPGLYVRRGGVSGFHYDAAWFAAVAITARLGPTEGAWTVPPPSSPPSCAQQRIRCPDRRRLPR